MGAAIEHSQISLLLPSGQNLHQEDLLQDLVKDRCLRVEETTKIRSVQVALFEVSFIDMPPWAIIAMFESHQPIHNNQLPGQISSKATFLFGFFQETVTILVETKPFEGERRFETILTRGATFEDLKIAVIRLSGMELGEHVLRVADANPQDMSVVVTDYMKSQKPNTSIDFLSKEKNQYLTEIFTAEQERNVKREEISQNKRNKKSRKCGEEEKFHPSFDGKKN